MLVLFAEYTDLDPEPARSLLREHNIEAELLERDGDGRVAPHQREAVGIIAGYSQIDANLIDQLPHLGIIATSSNGTDMVDVAHAVKRGVWVTNVGHAATEEVAIHTLTLMLTVIRELTHMREVVAGGGWTDDLTRVPRRASELTVGLVGYGRIGAATAKLLTGVFGRVVAYDPARRGRDGAVRFVDLDELTRVSNVVSLHTPLLPSTRGLFDAKRIAELPRGAVLVNVSRGELVDLDACLAALESGQLAGVGFDVLVGEPPAADHPLRSHPRAVLTPHAAFLSDASLRHYETDPARYIVDWVTHGRPSACVVGDPQQHNKELV